MEIYQIEEFRQTMQRAGLPAPSKIIPDELFHRFSTNGRPKDDAGWYVVNAQPFLSASFGCWRTGIKGFWSSIDSLQMTSSQKKEFDELIKEHRKINDQKRQKAQLKASLSARRIWNEAQDASSSHPYLKQKKFLHMALKQTITSCWFQCLTAKMS